MGMKTLKHDPMPGFEFISINPLCFSTKLCVTERPNPTPCPTGRVALPPALFDKLARSLSLSLFFLKMNNNFTVLIPMVEAFWVTEGDWLGKVLGCTNDQPFCKLTKLAIRLIKDFQRVAASIVVAK